MNKSASGGTTAYTSEYMLYAYIPAYSTTKVQVIKLYLFRAWQLLALEFYGKSRGNKRTHTMAIRLTVASDSNSVRTLLDPFMYTRTICL